MQHLFYCILVKDVHFNFFLNLVYCGGFCMWDVVTIKNNKKSCSNKKKLKLKVSVRLNHRFSLCYELTSLYNLKYKQKRNSLPKLKRKKKK